MFRATLLRRLGSIESPLLIVAILAGVVYAKTPVVLCVSFCVVGTLAYMFAKSLCKATFYTNTLVLNVLLGIFIATFVRVYTDAHRVRFTVDPASIVTIEGVLQNDALYSGSTAVQHKIIARRFVTTEGISAETTGFLNVFAPVQKSGFRGDTIVLNGVFQVAPSGASLPTKKHQDAVPAKEWRFRVRSVELYEVSQGINFYRKQLFLAITKRISGLPSRISSLLQALFLGDRSYLDPILKAQFRESGNAHILALSGMHLSLLSLVVTTLLRSVFNKRISLCITAAVVTLYCILVGPIPSLVRAYSMVLVFCVTRVCRIDIRVSTVLYTSLILCAVFYPRLLGEFSFILSSLALVGIVVLLPVITSVLQRYIPYVFAATIGASLAPIVASSPVILSSFGVIYTGGIFVSAILGLLVSVFLLLGIVFIVVPRFSFIVPILELLFDAALFVTDIGRLFPRFNQTWFIVFVSCGVFLYVFDQLLYRKKCLALGLSE